MRILYRPRINIVPPNTCYGVLYNWYVTQEDIAPSGWHVPDSTELATLLNEIDTYDSESMTWPNAGGKLKQIGTAYWTNTDETVTNEYGFSAVGSGIRNDVFFGFKEIAEYLSTDTTNNLFDNTVLIMRIDDDAFNACSIGGNGGMIEGYSIRLIKDNSTDTGTMTDYDGNVYPTVKIGDQVWMAENLKVTHYNDGTPIPNVTDSATWVGLSSGAMCAYNNNWNYACVEEPAICFEGYGLLYNWYAATDARKISSSDDWVVPTKTQLQTLETYLGGSTVAGGKLKEQGLAYWSPNVDATNESMFNGRAGGQRGSSGSFNQLNNNMVILSSTSLYSLTATVLVAYSSDDNSNITDGSNYKTYGESIRLLYTGAGTPTSYTGNDGKVYRVVHIGTQYWLADNLQETKFRNEDIIPYHGSDNGNNFTNAEWAALTSAGVCAYDNDVDNVGCDFTFPTE